MNGENEIVNLPFKYSWKIYFHDFMDSNWNRDSYEYLATINTIQDFWSVFHVMKEWMSHGMFFIMKDEIFPKWDDNDNKAMSYLSMKILKTKTNEFMEQILVLLMSNTLMKNNDQCDIINGVSISPKKNFCICKVWIDTTNDEMKDICLFNIPQVYHGDVFFRNFI